MVWRFFISPHSPAIYQWHIEERKKCTKKSVGCSSGKKISPYIEHIQLRYNVKHVSQNPFTLAGCCCCCCCCLFVCFRSNNNSFLCALRRLNISVGHPNPTSHRLGSATTHRLLVCRFCPGSRRHRLHVIRHVTFTHGEIKSRFYCPDKKSKLNRTVKNNKWTLWPYFIRIFPRCLVLCAATMFASVRPWVAQVYKYACLCYPFGRCKWLTLHPYCDDFGFRSPGCLIHFVGIHVRRRTPNVVVVFQSNRMHIRRLLLSSCVTLMSIICWFGFLHLFSVRFFRFLPPNSLFLSLALFRTISLSIIYPLPYIVIIPVHISNFSAGHALGQHLPDPINAHCASSSSVHCVRWHISPCWPHSAHFYYNM